MIQSFFDRGCSAWYPSLQKNLLKRLKVSQNNFVKFFFKTGGKDTNRTCRV